MGSLTPNNSLPDKNSPLLHLTHPTSAEKIATWTLNGRSWGTAIGTSSYLEREAYLCTVPLAREGGITHWILVDSSLPPDHRPILASCESLRKRAFVSRNGKIQETITHGVGSVFCNPDYRGKGYAGRMMELLGPLLRDWQTVPGKVDCHFSILYSDIGKKFYSGYGWLPFPSTHIAFPPGTISNPETAKRLENPDIEALCKWDEERVKEELKSVQDGKTHVAIVPDHDQMQWHHLREDFLTKKLFSRSPSTRGAIAGAEGARVWAIWTRSFYGPIDKTASGNTLHVLRLVVEDERKTEENARALKGILVIAQKEAEEWKLNHVELWNPTIYVKDLVERTGLKHESVEREAESIASLMWYGEGEGEGKVEEIEWVQNEKYGWC